ncbi:hypothetical protein CC80DRAFT_546225 [Byssothecium circinans]|uniref:Mid2 domain-containing protein n=1 Tax=Byssothecium circinans TaxID=147558 RepID=A0A6A5UCR1_9PLEO|nr:hypothetical protein CC80DRAFT_546225 [Byssothecium circinans]
MYSLIGLATVLSLSSGVASQCYFPNGKVVASDTICNPNALVSSCCYDNQACLSNGLCMSDPHSPTKARLHRGTCSDKTWKSSACPRQCTSLADKGANVYSCNQTNADSYCCFDDCKCNDNKFETFTFPDTDVYTLTIIGEAFTQTHTSTTKTSATSGGTAASITGSSSSSPSASAAASSSNSTAIGVGVGVSVGVVLLILAAVFFFWRHKRNASPKDSENPYNNGAGAHGLDNKQSPHYSLAEMDSGEPATQYHAPASSHSQKYAHHASENSHPPSQRNANSDRQYNAPPVELTSTNTNAPVELPSSPLDGPKHTKRRGY